MNLQKFLKEIQLLKKFANDMEDLYGALLLLNLNGLPQQDQNFIEDMAKILTESTGPLAGKDAEFQLFVKYRFHKGRNVIYQGNIADVTIDYNGSGGKAVQCKSSYQDDCATIVKFIADAANQLTGERGETPRQGDRWVIDMTIRSPNNPFPFSNQTTRGTKNLDEYKAEAATKIKGALETYKAGKKGLNQTAFNKMTDTQGMNLRHYDGSPTKSRIGNFASYIPPGSMPVQVMHSIVSLTVKIRYDFPYPVYDGMNWRLITKVAFEAVRNNNNLNVVFNNIAFAN